MAREDRGVLTATLVTTRAGIDALAAQWEELRRSLEASPFVGPTLYTAWFEEFGRKCRPFVVEVRDATGRLCAIAPWARRGPLAFSLPGRVKVAGELVVDPSDARAAWQVILRTAFKSTALALLIVPHATDDLPGIDGALEAASLIGLPALALPRFRRFSLSLEGTDWDQYLSTWSAKTRASLRYTRNRLSRMGDLRFVELDAVEGYDLLRELHVRQWTPGRTISWVHLDGGARIDKTLINEMRARVLLLYLDEQVIVASLYIDSGRRRVFEYTTRDQGIRRTSPGQLMHAEKIQRAFADGIREIDLMGEGGHKERYALDEHVGYELLIGRPGPVGWLAVRARVAQLWLRGLPRRARRYFS